MNTQRQLTILIATLIVTGLVAFGFTQGAKGSKGRAVAPPPVPAPTPHGKFIQLSVTSKSYFTIEGTTMTIEAQIYALDDAGIIWQQSHLGSDQWRDVTK